MDLLDELCSGEVLYVPLLVDGCAYEEEFTAYITMLVFFFVIELDMMQLGY